MLTNDDPTDSQVVSHKTATNPESGLPPKEQGNELPNLFSRAGLGVNPNTGIALMSGLL